MFGLKIPQFSVTKHLPLKRFGVVFSVFRVVVNFLTFRTCLSVCGAILNIATVCIATSYACLGLSLQFFLALPRLLLGLAHVLVRLDSVYRCFAAFDDTGLAFGKFLSPTSVQDLFERPVAILERLRTKFSRATVLYNL